MKKSIIWVVLLAGVITTFNSCKEDPEPIPIVVGTWERDIYEFSDLPANFQNFDGYQTESVYYGEEGYTLTINQGGKYTRKISFTGPDINDTGAWTHEGDNFTLKSDDNDIDDDEFKVVGEITANKLVLSQVLSFNLLPDAVTDTLTNAWASSHPDDLDQYYQSVDVTVLFLFEK